MSTLKQTVIGFWVVSAVAAASSCSTKCDVVCAAYNTCSVEERPRRVDCFNYCARIDAFEASTVPNDANIKDGCNAELTAHLDCWTNGNTLSSVCKRTQADGGYSCGDTGAAYEACMRSYCRTRSAQLAPDGGVRWDYVPACSGTPNYNACSAPRSPQGCAYCVVGSGPSRQYKGEWSGQGFIGAGPAVDTELLPDGGAQGAPLVPRYTAAGAFDSYGPPELGSDGRFRLEPRTNVGPDGGAVCTASQPCGVIRINVSNTCTDPFSFINTTFRSL